MDRPPLLRWLWYAAGGGLPDRYRDWVLHDTTGSTWLLRHFARVLVVLIIPTFLVVVLIPASAGLRTLTAVTTAGCAFLLSGILSNDTTERRLNRMGYPWGTAARLRAERAEQAQRSSAERYRQRRAKRHG
jgi:Family of unknown function (DUF5313)